MNSCSVRLSYGTIVPIAWAQGVGRSNRPAPTNLNNSFICNAGFRRGGRIYYKGFRFNCAAIGLSRKWVCVIRALAQKSAWAAHHENIFVLGPPCWLISCWCDEKQLSELSMSASRFSARTCSSLCRKRGRHSIICGAAIVIGHNAAMHSVGVVLGIGGGITGR